METVNDNSSLVVFLPANLLCFRALWSSLSLSTMYILYVRTNVYLWKYLFNKASLLTPKLKCVSSEKEKKLLRTGWISCLVNDHPHARIQARPRNKEPTCGPFLLRAVSVPNRALSHRLLFHYVDHHHCAQPSSPKPWFMKPCQNLGEAVWALFIWLMTFFLPPGLLGLDLGPRNVVLSDAFSGESSVG